ncbi:uncharacterized protein LOC134819039 [Bolinopsis microptera]|uniref:uncharacterized protein LOC134819039 n=1 Tax=Bolinopsis microptera TaxID=2820187 RepID=UPI003078DC1F
MNTRKRGYTTWANLRLKSKNLQLNNVFFELYKGTNMKTFVESLIGKEVKKLKGWENLSSAQQVTRVEWIVDELKEAGVLKNSFYCEYPALGRGSYDEAEWFLWCMVKADIYRVFENTLSYFEDNTLLLNSPYSYYFKEEDTDPVPKGRSLFAKSEEEIDEERRNKQDERSAWKAKLRPTSSCIDMVVKYLSRISEGKGVMDYFQTLGDLKDARVLLTFVNSLYEDVFTPDIMLNDKWSVNLALEAISNILRIKSDFDSEDLVAADNQAMCAYLACIFNKALDFKQTERVVKRLRTIKEKLAVYNKELDEMSKISMSANESRQKKELLLKVEVLKKEYERLGTTYDITKLQIWMKDAEAERLRVHAVVAYRLRQRFISEPVKRPIVISNLIDLQYINLSLTNSAAFYTSKNKETVSPTRRIVLYDKKQDLFIEDFSGFRDPKLPKVRELLMIAENEMSDIFADDYEEEFVVYFESHTRNRTLKPGQEFLYQLFPGSQVFLQKVYHKRVKAGDLLTVKKLIKFYDHAPEFIDSKDIWTGNTGLHLAVKYSHFNIVLYLLEQGAKVELPNQKGKTPFFIAAERFDRLICKLLIEWGADIFTKNSYQKSALELMNNEKFRDFVTGHYQYIKQNSIAILAGDMELLNKVVLDHKYKAVELSSAKTRCFEGLTCMHVAAKFGAIPIIEILAEMGVSVKIRDSQGATPLHYVHDVVTCQVLIEHGADVNATDLVKDTPLHYLCSSRAGTSDNQIDIAEVLANYGASLSVVNKRGYMPLHYCAIQGRADYIMLLMHEDEENIKEILSHQMTTPTLTYLAFHHNNIRCARWLLSVGLPLVDDEATILLRELLQNTERSLRIKVETCSLLLENGADPNAVYEKTGHPVLHITTKSVQTIELLGLLIEHGANLEIKNREGQTPLFAAVKYRNIHAAKFLIEKGAQIQVKDLQNKLPFQHLSDYSEWLSRSMLDDTSESLLKQCSLHAERNLVKNISQKLKGNSIDKSGPC